MVDPDYHEITYGELAELTNRIVHGLRAADLVTGDQVTTVLPNGIEQVAMSLAAYQGGFYLTTVNWHLAGPEIAYIVNDSETKAFIVHEDFAAQALKVLEDSDVPSANRFSVGSIDSFRPLSELIEGQPATRPDDLTTGSFMFYTSGTTGRPKGVRRALPGVHPDESASGSGGLFMLLGIMPHHGQRPYHAGSAVPHRGEHLDHHFAAHGASRGGDGPLDG